MSTPSRGDCISGYLPNFGGTSGVKSYKDNLKAQVVTGTVVSGGAVQAFTHALGGTPSLVQVSPLYAAGDVVSATTGVVVGESAASAATASSIYVVANKNAVKFKAFIML